MEQVIFSTDQTITLQVNFHGISFSFKICEQQYYFHVANIVLVPLAHLSRIKKLLLDLKNPEF